jgi:hypothetical protein
VSIDSYRKKISPFPPHTAHFTVMKNVFEKRKTLKTLNLKEFKFDVSRQHFMLRKSHIESMLSSVCLLMSIIDVTVHSTSSFSLPKITSFLLKKVEEQILILFSNFQISLPFCFLFFAGTSSSREKVEASSKFS